ncbi:MAG: SpoIIE family protein phosphatase [Pyrinomonadaceae bacterium]
MPELIQALQKKLDQRRAELDASSCTFYFRDPYWPDEFRLVAMSNVRFKEPMYGFVSPESARRTIAKGDDKIYITQTRIDKKNREQRKVLESVPESKLLLFGDFVQREGVQAYARLIHTNKAGERDAVLFINFSEKGKKFDDGIKLRFDEFFDELLAEFEKIQDKLIKRDAIWLTEATKIVSPEMSIANIDFYTLDKPDPYFTKIIESALKALHIKPGTGLGTLHLYNAEDQTLKLHGSFGVLDKDKAERHSVKTGEGVVSWVVLRRKALLIRDIEKSDFKEIHVCLNKDVRSELAVPLEAGGELVGVMCLECTEVDGFLPHHVRSMWYAVNRAAIIYQLHQQVSMNRKLLELSWKATGTDRAEARTSLAEVAALAQNYLKGSFCEIWRYNSDAERFDNWGASYQDFGSPGSEGWTKFVLQIERPIWIGDIKSDSEFSVHYWEAGDWHEGAPDENYPKKLNTKSIKKGTRSALGIPIKVQATCIGVAWVMYRRERLECPKPGLMSLALGFAAEAGLVLDSIQRQEGELRDKWIIDDVGDKISRAIEERWELKDSELLDAHVISKPFHSELGGDFYAGKRIDDETVGILLLDGQGHGVEGSLHMLPLMTAFELSWQSYSTAHVISQLSKTAKAVGVKGTAIYCIFSQIENRKWMSVTSAGHESLMLFRKEKGRWVQHPYPELHGQMFGYPKELPWMDDRVQLFEGDIIVGYTDGVAEQNTNFDANSVNSIVFNVLIYHGDIPETIAEAIMQASRKQHPEGFQDDATVFVVRVK